MVDSTGVVTDLSGASPKYTVVAVDPTTDLDTAPTIYNDASTTAAGMVIKALLDTTTGGAGGGSGGAWALGKWRLYVKFTDPSSGDVPRLGPFDFYVV